MVFPFGSCCCTYPRDVRMREMRRAVPFESYCCTYPLGRSKGEMRRAVPFGSCCRTYTLGRTEEGDEACCSLWVVLRHAPSATHGGGR